MRILVLGGTVFLGRAVARAALAAGHDVTCVARGASGEPVEGARFVAADRSDPAGLAGLDGDFDAVVDVARTPRHVRHAVHALAGRVGHVSYVSTISVYADTATPGQRATTSPLVAPAGPELDDTTDPEAYAAAKMACELLWTDGFGVGDVFVCRAGLLIGPEDPVGRFEYWLRRARRGGEILVPGTPDDLVQVVDARDLAGWIVQAAEDGLVGPYDGTGAAVTRREFMRALVGDGATLTYVPQEFLLAHQVAPWHGPRSLPVWLPEPDYAGVLSRDVTPSLAAGLRTRPLTETVKDTQSWLDAGGAGEPMGLTGEEEAEILRAWHSR
jgi:nucleoside-diphosphate-sugar epimerase